MSKVTDIKNYLSTLVDGALPSDFLELPDNLATEDNSNTYLEKGFAISYGPAENDVQNWCQGSLLITRQYDVIVTSNYVPNNDETYRGGLESDLMEAIYLILVALRSDLFLGGLVFDTSPDGDSGIQYLVDEGEQKQIITASLSLNIRYRETF